MIVGLLTTWNEPCGIAGYARNLTKSLEGTDVRFDIISRDRWSTNGVLSSPCTVLHVNYEPGLFQWISLMDLQHWRAAGKRIIFTWHTSQEQGNATPMHPLIDKVVMHERTDETEANADKYVFIPHGVEVYDEDPQTVEQKIGTAGFPFPWKGFTEVARVARMLGMGCLVIAPESPHYDTYVIKAVVMAANPETDYRTQWITTREVARELSKCVVNVFAYHGANYGISGAARLGLTARRPLVLTRNRQFRDLFDYEDEIGFSPSPDPQDLARAVTATLNAGKMPGKLLYDMAWETVGLRYADLYHELGA